jgi:hypothetical protein
MSHNVDAILLDVLATDVESPPASLIRNVTGQGMEPVATQSLSGFFDSLDKTKLDNMSANGSGDDWMSGLCVTAHSPNNQTVDYTLGQYMVNGLLYNIASGGVYNLANGFGGVNHYTGLANGQRRSVLVYVDIAQVMKSVAGDATSGTHPVRPEIPVDTVALAFVEISKSCSGSNRVITSDHISDVRQARQPTVDELVKISANDTTSGFLGSKLTNNGNVKFTIENADNAESLSASVSLSSSEVKAAGTTTTTSTNYSLLGGMTLAPAAGQYLAIFSTSVVNSSTGSEYCILAVGGSQIAETESCNSGSSYSGVSINKIITVTTGQVVEVYWKISAGTGTARARVLTLLKVG